ncbi:MAG TPA: polyribonucleotide nucleotidyltransferase [Alcanivoracaceae bacterium]|nr:polyribonucleotide nucleotidyltransferase [Alcanivoracaceae bacterium]
MPKSLMKRALATVLGALLVFELSGCGTVIYPERRGQTGGKIDPMVVVMDGIGLLFWVVPGLIAFGVDFATGAIYSPSGHASVAPEKLEPAVNAAGEVDTVKLQEIIQQETGQALPFDHPAAEQQGMSLELLSQLQMTSSA